MEGLGRDVMVSGILRRLSWSDRCRMAQVCGKMREAVLTPSLWACVEVVEEEAALLPSLCGSVYGTMVRKAVVGLTPLSCMESVTAVGTI